MERAFPLELTALVGEGETSTLLSNFSGAGDELESLGPLLGLARVRDGTLSRAEYIERYGHHPASCLRLFSAILAEINEEGLTGRTYIIFQGTT